MPRLRILEVTSFFHPDSLGGSNRVVYELSKGLTQKGHEVHVLAPRLQPSLPAREELEGIHVSRYPVFGSRWSIRNLTSIPFIVLTYRALRRGVNFDIVHSHDTFAHLGIGLATRGQRTQSVTSFYSPAHVELKVENPKTNPLLTNCASLWYRAIDGWSFGRAKRIIVLSQFSKVELQTLFKVPEHKILVAPGGVDYSKFCPGEDPNQAKRALSLPPDRPLLLTVRRLAHRMGLENLIEAMPLVIKAEPKILLIIGGQGTLRRRLESLIQRHALEDNVELAGFIPEEKLPLYYRAADLFILPTVWHEGFGLVTLEALASGTPVLSTPIGTSTEILRDLDKSLLLPGTDPASIANGIIELVRDPNRLLRLRQICSRYVRSRFSWENMVGSTEEMFLELCRAAGQAGLETQT